MSSEGLLLDRRLKIFIVFIFLSISIALVLVILLQLNILSIDLSFIVSFFAILLGMIAPSILIAFMIIYKRNKELIID